MRLVTPFGHYFRRHFWAESKICCRTIGMTYFWWLCDEIVSISFKFRSNLKVEKKLKFSEAGNISEEISDNK